MKLRKLLVFVPIWLALTLVLVIAIPTAAQETTLNIWITWGDNPAQIQELFNRYGDEHGVNVIVNSPVTTDQVVAGLSGTEPPDVLVTGGPGSVGTWARENLLTPLDEFIETAGVDMNDMFQAPLGQCQYGGQYYCLPWGTDTYALFWNKDLFEEAGLDVIRRADPAVHVRYVGRQSRPTVGSTHA